MRNYPMQDRMEESCKNCDSREMPYRGGRDMTEEASRNCNSREMPYRSGRDMMAGRGMRPVSDCRTEQQVTMAYVPWQQFCTVYEPEKGLIVGTIFPELDKPFLARGGRMR